MIEITREPRDMGPPAERCCFCKKVTPYWAGEGDIPVCELCAQFRTPDDLPAKEAWLKAPE